MFTVVIPKVVTKATKLVDKGTGAFLMEQLVKISHPDLFTDVQASVLLEATQKEYEPGTYELGADSITAGEYGRPAFRLKIGKRLDAVKKAA